MEKAQPSPFRTHRQFSLQTRFRSGSVNQPTKSMKRAEDRTVLISMIDSLRNRK
jgi:hypothetical protein